MLSYDATGSQQTTAKISGLPQVKRRVSGMDFDKSSAGRKSRIDLVFKNMERSELAREAALKRLEAVFSKFRFLEKCRITTILAMENSPQQAGPDLFSVTVQIHGLSKRHLILTGAAPSLYLALAQLSELLSEKLIRFRDRTHYRYHHRRLMPFHEQNAEAEPSSTRRLQ